jgi:two-component system chemotaxis response regulator CheB
VRRRPRLRVARATLRIENPLVISAKREAQATPLGSGAFDLVACASSAGGLHALSELLSRLPVDFQAAITAVQHLDRRHRSLMADILSRRTRLSVKEAEAAEKLRVGTVYIAPPDHHLLVNPDGRLALADSELVHFLRPSADLLFESVAASFRDRAIGVVLTGTGKDAAMGVTAIKSMGGTVIAQDPKTAEFPGMPEAAIATGKVDFVLPLAEIADALVTLIMKGD